MPKSPVWLHSQHLNVGYSFLWVTPPVEVYSMNPISSVNGVSLLGKAQLGPGILEAELVGGKGADRFWQLSAGEANSFRINMTNALVLDLSYAVQERYKFRAAYTRASVTGALESSLRLPGGSIPAIPVDTELKTSTTLDIGQGQLYSLGFSGEQEGWGLSTEFARRIMEGSSFSRASGYYVSVSRRLSNWVVHGTYSWQGDLTGSMRLHPDYPTVTALQTGAFSWIAGVNFMPVESVVLKAEYTRTALQFDNSLNDLNMDIFRLSTGLVF